MSNNYYFTQSNQDQYSSSSSSQQQQWPGWPIDHTAIPAHDQHLLQYQGYSSYYDTAKLAHEARLYASASNAQRYQPHPPSYQANDMHESYRQQQPPLPQQPPPPPPPPIPPSTSQISRYRNPFHPSQNQQNQWPRRNNQNRKRQRYELYMSGRNPQDAPKKKHKPQNDLNPIQWNREDAIKALKVEKEHSKMKSLSLVIRFPDLELNRDIVKDFHPAIESVHFQQASTPRFCNITLDSTADLNIIKSTLCRQKFGDGYLQVELKKDKEEEQDASPEEIDPYTLYVDNISSEVPEDTIREKYPETIKINIGYAQKMKNSRYAFVRFKNVDDAIAAFKDTLKMDNLSKNLKVRFRRLHGNVGMPGETKQQNPPKAVVPDYKVPEPPPPLITPPRRIEPPPRISTYSPWNRLDERYQPRYDSMYDPYRRSLEREEDEYNEYNEYNSSYSSIDLSYFKRELRNDSGSDDDYWYNHDGMNKRPKTFGVRSNVKNEIRGPAIRSKVLASPSDDSSEDGKETGIGKVKIKKEPQCSTSSSSSSDEEKPTIIVKKEIKSDENNEVEVPEQAANIKKEPIDEDENSPDEVYHSFLEGTDSE